MHIDGLSLLSYNSKAVAWLQRSQGREERDRHVITIKVQIFIYFPLSQSIFASHNRCLTFQRIHYFDFQYYNAKTISFCCSRLINCYLLTLHNPEHLQTKRRKQKLHQLYLLPDLKLPCSFWEWSWLAKQQGSGTTSTSSPLYFTHPTLPGSSGMDPFLVMLW